MPIWAQRSFWISSAATPVSLPLPCLLYTSGLALRGSGQKDPVVEYRIVGFDMCDQMVDSIRESSVKMLLTIEIRQAGACLLYTSRCV